MLSSSVPLSISLIIASFGSSTPYHNHAFDLILDLDPSSRIITAGDKLPVRYGKRPEIHHTFKQDPRSPPKIITVIFTAAVVATLPILAITVDKSLSLHPPPPFFPFHFCTMQDDSLIQERAKSFSGFLSARISTISRKRLEARQSLTHSSSAP